MYDTVRHQTSQLADAVLHQVHSLLKSQPDPVVPLGHRWPRSNRRLYARIDSKVGNFWDNITCTHTIDLSHFQLPELKEVKFTFVDPVWVWLQQVALLHQKGHKLVWDPEILEQHGTGSHMYGAGIEFGSLLLEAKRSIPTGARAALINLSGTRGTRRGVLLLSVCRFVAHIYSLINSYMCGFKTHMCDHNRS